MPTLLRSIAALDYPTDRLRVVLVDDFSTDGDLAPSRGPSGSSYPEPQENLTPNRLGQRPKPAQRSEYELSVLHLADHYVESELVAHKKAALDLAIRAAPVGHWILTTDADCTLPPDLLQRLDRCIQCLNPAARVILGPVMNAPVSGLCDHFQALDLAAYQFLTAVSIFRGKPTLANGACLAFERSAFLEVDGYAGVDHLPSGDDVLLLHKFAATLPPAAFDYLRHGEPVLTRPVGGWRATWAQRLRWAGKAGEYQATGLKFAQALSWLAALSTLALLILAWHPRPRPLALIALTMKFTVDFVGLALVTRRHGHSQHLRYYPAIALIYPFFLTAVGLVALTGRKTTWKGR